jgi:hypothetical protein
MRASHIPRRERLVVSVSVDLDTHERRIEAGIVDDHCLLGGCS